MVGSDGTETNRGTKRREITPRQLPIYFGSRCGTTVAETSVSACSGMIFREDLTFGRDLVK